MTSKCLVIILSYLLLYSVKLVGNVLLGAEHLMFNSNPRVKNLACRCNLNVSAYQDVQGAQSNLSTPPIYFSCALSATGNFPEML